MGCDYWQPLMDFLRNTMVANKTISPGDLDLFFVTDDPDQAMDTIIHHFEAAE